MRKQVRRNIIAALQGVPIGLSLALIWSFSPPWVRDEVRAATRSLHAPSLLLAALFWLPLSVVFHELGHVFAGWMVGSRFVSLVLGPLQIDRKESRLRLRWTGARLIGGLALCIPERSAHLRRNMLIFI